MWGKIYNALFGLTVNEHSISTEAKVIRTLFEALKREGFNEQQALDLVVAKLNRRNF